MANERLLPAYPLFVKDPYFSFWKGTDVLTDGDVIFWAGAKKDLYGILKIDGRAYRFMGGANVPAMEQVSLSVSAFTTDYVFKTGDVKLTCSFVSPLPLNDMKTLSCPVCYVNYEIESSSAHEFEISLVMGQNVFFNDTFTNEKREHGMCGGVFALDGFETAWFGPAKQAPLSIAEDNACAEWGYWYLAGEKGVMTDRRGLNSYLCGDEVSTPTAEQQKSGRNTREQYILASNSTKKGKLMIAFDDVAACRYYGKFLYDYYFEGGKTIIDALTETFKTSADIDKKLADFDKDLREKAKPFGEEYLNVLYASLRQSIAMHKLCKDTEGNVLFLSREADSNSCIATVDVSYPSFPLYLLYDTEYVKGMMRPIFKFARMPVWTYDFAPHDGGTYPNCDGQVYGVDDTPSRFHATYCAYYPGEMRTRPFLYLYPSSFHSFKLDSQMPVEESANMIIMSAACYRKDGKKDFLEENFDLLEKWVVYLEKFGLVPDKQLCTDDFAGHLDKNINLAIKACVGIRCFSEICRALNKGALADKYEALAKDYSEKIEAFSKKFKWCPITWDNDDTTFSLKYNLAFDKILGYGLFTKDFYTREYACYKEKILPYGVPLDSRATYGKSDWLLWTASLAYSVDDALVIVKAVNRFLKETKSRIAFSDWYDMQSGNYRSFIGRTVQGGNFILLLNGRI